MLPARRRPFRAGAVRRSTQPLKGLGESAAAEYLEARGFRLLSKNWRARVGELDLIALEGSTLVFVEVKTRAGDDFADPALSVDGPKQKRVRRVAQAYLAFERPRHSACRFDVVSVIADGRSVRIRHIVNAF